MTSQQSVVRRLGASPGRAISSLFRSNRSRTIPAAVLEGTELIQLGGGELVPCPGIGSLPLAQSARQVGLGSTSLALPPAKVHVLRDVRLCPGSRVVVASKDRIVAESLTSDMVGEIDLIDEELRGAPVEMDGTVALYRSPWKPYYHTLVDHLPRAALLAQPAMRRVGAITVVHDGPLTPVETALLPRLLGGTIRLLQVEPGRSIRAERVLLPNYVTRPSAGAIPSWYRRWIDREAAAVGQGDDGQTPTPRRIFVDRTRGRRKVLNRASLDSVLDGHDVATIDPLAMSVEDQVRCFRDAELVIGVTGSGLANILFSRSARVIELMPGTELLPHFYYLAAAKGLPYDYVVARQDQKHLSAEQRLHDDVFVDTEALGRLLDNLV